MAELRERSGRQSRASIEGCELRGGRRAAVSTCRQTTQRDRARSTHASSSSVLDLCRKRWRSEGCQNAAIRASDVDPEKAERESTRRHAGVRRERWSRQARAGPLATLADLRSTRCDTTDRPSVRRARGARPAARRPSSAAASTCPERAARQAPAPSLPSCACALEQSRNIGERASICFYNFEASRQRRPSPTLRPPSRHPAAQRPERVYAFMPTAQPTMAAPITNAKAKTALIE